MSLTQKLLFSYTFTNIPDIKKFKKKSIADSICDTLMELKDEIAIREAVFCKLSLYEVMHHHSKHIPKWSGDSGNQTIMSTDNNTLDDSKSQRDSIIPS